MHYLGALPQESLGHLFGLIAAVVFGAMIGFERQLRDIRVAHQCAVALGRRVRRAIH